MRTQKLLAMVLVPLFVIAAIAEEGTPDKAVCRTCQIRGAAHGEEDVVASRHHDGRDYYFCSEDCAKAFDAFPAAYAVRPVPRSAPAMTVATIDARTVEVGKPGGHALLLDFWATWCAPCIKAMPKLEQLQGEYADRGLTVLGISIDEDPKAVEKFLQKKRLGYAVAIDSADSPAWHAFAVAAIPAMVLIDREGQIVAEWQGKIEIDSVKQTVESLLVPSDSD